MTLSALGIFSAAGAGGAAFSSDYELIETQILGSSQASVVFSSLGTYSSTYKHLQIRAVPRSDRADTDDVLFARVNGDTGSSYMYHLLFGDGASVSSSAAGIGAEKMELGRVAGGSNASGIYGQNVIDVLDAFSATKYKTFRSLAGLNRATTPYVILYSGVRFNTASISSISLFSQGNLVAGSRFSLYGIKG